jgi:phage-related protein
MGFNFFEDIIAPVSNTVNDIFKPVTTIGTAVINQVGGVANTAGRIAEKGVDTVSNTVNRVTELPTKVLDGLQSILSSPGFLIAGVVGVVILVSMKK